MCRHKNFLKNFKNLEIYVFIKCKQSFANKGGSGCEIDPIWIHSKKIRRRGTDLKLAYTVKIYTLKKAFLSSLSLNNNVKIYLLHMMLARKASPSKKKSIQLLSSFRYFENCIKILEIQMMNQRGSVCGVFFF